MTTDQRELGTEVASVGEASPETQEEGQSPDVPGHALTPLERALERGLDVDVIERMVALQERREERDAEAAMAEALAAFQADCPEIPKTGKAEVRKNGQLQYTYQFPKLDVAAKIIRPHLAAHGLSYVHDAEIDGNSVAITCTLQHVLGAKRTATFRGPLDKSGGKNPIQEVASAQSYGRRYSLFNVLGLTAGEDDDGVGAGGQEVQTITDQQLATLNTLAGEADADIKAFCEFMAVDDMAAIPARQFRFAENVLKEKIERAKKEGDE